MSILLNISSADATNVTSTTQYTVFNLSQKTKCVFILFYINLMDDGRMLEYAISSEHFNSAQFLVRRFVGTNRVFLPGFAPTWKLILRKQIIGGGNIPSNKKGKPLVCLFPN